MYYLIGSLVALIGILVTIHLFRLSQENKRVDDFEKNLFLNYKGDGCVLECLIPSGIANLRNDKEIETGLGRLRNRLGSNPLRTWDNDVKKIGYKKFFQRVVIGPGFNDFNKNTIQVYINSFKNQDGIIWEDNESC